MADVVERLRETLERLVNAKALSGVREQVAGWNGEGREKPNERHPYNLGATLPKTRCGHVYELDEAMQEARAILSQLAHEPAGQSEAKAVLGQDRIVIARKIKAAIVGAEIGPRIAHPTVKVSADDAPRHAIEAGDDKGWLRQIVEEPDEYLERANAVLDKAGVPHRFRRFNIDEVKPIVEPPCLAEMSAEEMRKQHGFQYFECRDCGFDSVRRSADTDLRECPLCAWDTGRLVIMTSRVAETTDKPEGYDARALPTTAVREGGK